MSWNFREHEQREQIAELKNQLAVQGVKLGQFESQLIKNNEELTTTKNTLDETVYKLRKEADHAIELEETLAKRSEDLRNEKLTRENVENALQAVREELKSQTASTRDAQHLLNRLAQDANGSQEQYTKLLVDKGKLEAQVRELQGELRIYQLAPPSPTKLATRPRASSLTNLKVANLERDLQQTRASASSSQTDLDTTREKLSKVQNDLVRVENEKAVFEKRMAEKDRKLQDALEEKDDLMRELDFLRSQNGSAGREEELIARLEEEESKVALYEQQLSQMSQPNHLKRSLDRLHLQLANEITKREAIESQGVELVREKEEALDELDDMKRNVQELSETLRYKEAQIYELGRHERELQNQLDAARNLAASSPIEIDEGQVKHMLDAIDRLRAERDQLRTDFEFFQLETQFKVQALEKQVTFSQPSTTSVSDAELQQSQALAAHLSGKLNIGRIQVQKLQVAMSAMLVTVQYLHSQNEFLQERSLVTATSQETAASRGHAEVETLHSQLNEQQFECSSLGATLADLQERLGAKHAEVDFVETESRTILMSKDEELALAQARLSDASNTLESEREGRIALEQDVARLNANCASIQQELTDALERCEHLRDAQTSALPSDNGTHILKEEIKLLEGRVMRRTEQIGVHQHDIKRLETNMRLLEDRVEEVTGELDMAETEKTAMLEDCTTAREERDEAKKALELAEIEVERLTALVKQTKEEVRELQTHLAAAEGQIKESDAAKVDELATMANVVEERDSQINSLAENLKSAESALVEARAQTGNLRDELNLIQESTARTVEELQGQIQGDKSALSKELERRAGEMQRLSEELESVKAGHEEFSDALQSKDKELQRSADEVQRLTSELEAAERSRRENDVDRRSKDEEVERYAAEIQRLSSELELARVKHHETADALLIKEELLEGRADELQRLTLELEAATASHQEAAQKLQWKEEELEMNSKELHRLVSELEAAEAKQQEAASALRAKDGQFTQSNERLDALETEKSDLLARLAAFENDANQELGESTSLASIIEEERSRRENEVKKLENDFASLDAEKEAQLKESQSLSEELKARQEETLAILESTRKELEEQQTLYDVLALEQQKTSSSREEEVVALKEQIAKLTEETGELRQSLQEEIDNMKQDLEAREEELQAALDKQASSSAVESELRQNIQHYQEQLAEVRGNLMVLQDENTTMQSEMDNLSAECHRANLKSQSLESRLSSNEKELSTLRNELTSVRVTLSQSEKSGKTAEMNLLLMDQQHERTISNLRSQLKKHMNDGEKIQELQHTVEEMREQVSEMEGLLKAKCEEIEDNDDKFIQLLKEKKKLTSKVESLMKKNNSLQNKLSSASAGPSKTPSPPTQLLSHQATPPNPASLAPPKSSVSLSATVSTVTVPPSANSRAVFSSRPTPSRAKTPEPSRRSSANSSNKRPRDTAADTPSDDQSEMPAVTIGKKRRLPDDADAVCAPVEARFAESHVPMSSTPPMPSSSSMTTMSSMPSMFEMATTPRARRQAPRTGFTPVRGQNGTLRPTLSQPSPIRKSTASRALPSAITDVTNSPPKAKHVFGMQDSTGSSAPRAQKPAGKGWLGKIRGGGNNPLLRTRQQPRADDAS